MLYLKALRRLLLTVDDLLKALIRFNHFFHLLVAVDLVRLNQLALVNDVSHGKQILWPRSMDIPVRVILIQIDICCCRSLSYGYDTLRTLVP